MSVFFFNDTATTEIYTLSLHDALPICAGGRSGRDPDGRAVQRDRRDHARVAAGRDDPAPAQGAEDDPLRQDRKSTRLNSSHANISYAVFCLKKKKHYPCALIVCRTLST